MIRQAQIPKTSPEDAVELILRELELDRLDIFPDSDSQKLSEILDVGYAKLEQAIAALG
jgi:hypothetical protein